MDVITIPDASESWLDKASYWKTSTRRKHYRSFTEPTDILERLHILSAVCKWRGQNEQSQDFHREYELLEAKLKNPE